MGKKKQIVFKYFDIIYSSYKKHGRRSINMKSPHVLFEYMDDNGRTAFDYDTERESIQFDYGDFYTAQKMFGVSIPDLVDICKEYVANKFDIPKAANSSFLPKRLN